MPENRKPSGNKTLPTWFDRTLAPSAQLENKHETVSGLKIEITSKNKEILKNKAKCAFGKNVVTKSFFWEKIGSLLSDDETPCDVSCCCLATVAKVLFQQQLIRQNMREFIFVRK